MNKTRILKYIFLFLIGCCACKNLTNSRSSGILPMDSVAVLVADCFFLESEVYIKQWKYTTKDYSLVKYDSFFEKHAITKELFVENVKYYITHRRHAEKFIDKVDEIVEQRVAALRDSLDLE